VSKITTWRDGCQVITGPAKRLWRCPRGIPLTLFLRTMKTLAFALAAVLPAAPLLSAAPAQASQFMPRNIECMNHEQSAQWQNTSNGNRYRLLRGGQIIKTFRMANGGCNFTTAGYLNRNWRWNNILGGSQTVHYRLQNHMLVEIKNGGPQWGGTATAHYPTHGMQNVGYQPYPGHPHEYQPYPSYSNQPQPYPYQEVDYIPGGYNDYVGY